MYSCTPITKNTAVCPSRVASLVLQVRGEVAEGAPPEGGARRVAAVAGMTLAPVRAEALVPFPQLKHEHRAPPRGHRLDAVELVADEDEGVAELKGGVRGHRAWRG